MQAKHEITEIIYYDFGELTDVSYYIIGVLSNQTKYNYKLVIKRERPRFLNQFSPSEKWYRFVYKLAIFEFKNGDNNFFFCIDWCDHSSNYMNEGYLIPVLERVKYYFKTNYNTIAIDNDPDINKFRDKIIPIGLSFPLHIDNMIKFMPRIFPGLNNIWTYKESKERINLMFRKTRLSYLRRLRRIEPDLNLFFVMPYYLNQKVLNEYRYEVMRALQNQVTTNTIIGFAATQKVPEKYHHIKQSKFEMRSYYRHLARSKVAVYVRGPHDNLSSKFGQLLALGKPIIGQTILNNSSFYYQNPYFNEQYAYDDPEEIARQVHELLKDPDRAALYAKANANTFDTKFSPEITVSKIIEKLFD